MIIDVSEEKNCAIVSVMGRVDSYTAPQFSEALSRVTLSPAQRIILVLDNVSYISSAGFRVLIDTRKTCKKLNKGDLILVNVPARIYETLELAGFTPLFKFASSLSDALAQC
jgi:anti-sigma B factor antagonist